MAGTVAIVGRPNVGKSALFNRLVGRRLAIVDRAAGITRDRLGAEAEWRGVRFMLTDTGGIVPDPDEPLLEQVRLQAEVAIAEADVVLFVLDVTEGVTPLDQAVAELLRPAASRVVCVANKCDDARHDDGRYEFTALGLGDVFGVSALHGRRTAALLDEVVRRLPEERAAAAEAAAVRVAIVGKPNVGKSSFVNTLLKQERLVVDATPGTTRDAVDVAYLGPHGERFVLIDTAGIKRKKSTKVAVEKYSAIRSEEAIARCDVAILMIDASVGVTATDAKIAHLVEQHNRGCVIAVNKWDLVGARERTLHDEASGFVQPGRGLHEEASGFVQSKRGLHDEASGFVQPGRGGPARSGIVRQKDYTKGVFERLPFLEHCPVLYTVAPKGTNVGRALGRARKVFEAGAVKIATPRLNDVIAKALAAYQPPLVHNKRLKILYATQTRGNPPTFLLFVNDPKAAKDSYLAYLLKKIRAAEPYEGNPIVLRLRPR